MKYVVTVILAMCSLQCLAEVGVSQPSKGAQIIKTPQKIVVHPGAQQDVVIERDRKTPIRSTQCLERSGSGNCLAEEVTWGVQGVTCREDCLARDSFGSCRLSNTCKFDEDSGCFRKRVCMELGNFNDCKQWEEEVICK